MRVRFVCHPEVVIDPDVPVPRWHLSELGIARMRAYAGQIEAPCAIWASTEAKAIEAAGLLAARHGLPVQVHAGLDENDRSATGYLPGPAFQAAADAFFARPDRSYCGWERAVDAQARILSAWSRIVTQAESGALVLVGHGGTGTLLMLHLRGWPINRQHDAPRQGCEWVFDDALGGVVGGWQPIEAARPFSIEVPV